MSGVMLGRGLNPDVVMGSYEEKNSVPRTTIPLS